MSAVIHIQLWAASIDGLRPNWQPAIISTTCIFLWLIKLLLLCLIWVISTCLLCADVGYHGACSIRLWVELSELSRPQSVRCISPHDERQWSDV